MADPEKVFAAALEMGFRTLITGGPPQRLETFAREAHARGMECYFTFSSVVRKGDEALAQVMSPQEEQIFERLQADLDPRKSGYQFGGEPLPGRREVLLTRLLCFDQPEAVARMKQRLTDTLAACPSLDGVAFDYFGYQNYRCCYCPQTSRLFEAWRQEHPRLPEEKAREEFSRERLVAFYSDMADFVRSIRPGLKVAAHLYPVFLPEPLYGHRLKLDYSIETVSWFFEPYWTEEKMRRYTRIVCREGQRSPSGAKGIPFVALYVDRPIANVPVAYFAKALECALSEGDTSLCISEFHDVATREEYRRALKDALERNSHRAGPRRPTDSGEKATPLSK